MAPAFFILCLVLVTTSAAVPHGNRKLQEAAISILAHTEHRGGEILNKLLIEKSFGKGQTVSEQAMVTEVRQFLQEVLNGVTAFKAWVRASSQGNTEVLSGEEGRRHPNNHHASQLPMDFLLPPGIVLPPGWTPEDLAGLDYDEILDIIGDYTKGFMAHLVLAYPIFLDREDVLRELNSLVDQLLDAIKN